MGSGLEFGSGLEWAKEMVLGLGFEWAKAVVLVLTYHRRWDRCNEFGNKPRILLG